jgi:subtilisin family serine protease
MPIWHEKHLRAATRAAGVALWSWNVDTDAITMDVGAQTLPAMMVSYGDGISIKNQLAAHSSETATLDFSRQAFSVDPDKLADFSAKGPNVDGSIKPDMVAVGMYVYTAAQKFDSKGDLYDASGYSLVDGTSFSSPIVAGAAALLKEARPGLTVAQYRSLLVNTAAPAFLLLRVALLEHFVICRIEPDHCTGQCRSPLQIELPSHFGEGRTRLGCVR